MANEIRLVYPSGCNIYAVVRQQDGDVWYPTGEVFEEWGTSSRDANDYAIALTDKSGHYYVADFPTAITTAAVYIVQAYKRAGSVPADSDAYAGGPVEKDWTGTSVAAETVSEVSNTGICNWALAKVGGSDTTRRISAYSSTTDRIAQMCRDVYPYCRRSTIARFKWVDLMEFEDLGAALSGSSLIAGADWEYQFNLPSDCLYVIRMVDEDDRTTEYEYEVKQGRLLTDSLCNSDGDSAYIEYVKNEGNAGEFAPLFIEALATKLASELAPTLNPEWTEALITQFERLALPLAKAANQAQEYKDEKGEHSWLVARD